MTQRILVQAHRQQKELEDEVGVSGENAAQETRVSLGEEQSDMSDVEVDTADYGNPVSNVLI